MWAKAIVRRVVMYSRHCRGSTRTVAAIMMVSSFVALATIAPAGAVQAMGSEVARPILPPPQCPPGYYWVGQRSTNYSNQGLERYISSNTMAVQNPSFAHALSYLDAQDSSDPLLAPNSYDWLQLGFGVGAVDQADTSTPEVYVEDNDVFAENRFGHPNGSYYPGIPGGNDFFTVFFTGKYETDRGVRLGLYDGYIQVSGKAPQLIVAAWFAYPTSSILFAQNEAEVGIAGTGNEECPKWPGELYGTSGSSSSYSKSTELFVFNDSRLWEYWGTEIASTTHFADECFTSGCSTQLDNQYAYSQLAKWGAFDANGGDPFL